MQAYFKITQQEKNSASVITLALTLIPLYKTIKILVFLTRVIIFKILFLKLTTFLSFYIIPGIITIKRRAFIATS
jgi:hypothetical protein